MSFALINSLCMFNWDFVQLDIHISIPVKKLPDGFHEIDFVCPCSSLQEFKADAMKLKFTQNSSILISLSQLKIIIISYYFCFYRCA